MNSEARPSLPFPLAVAQMPITGDARTNADVIRASMREAAVRGARLIQFPEGALSGYAKHPIWDWNQVSWAQVRAELELVMDLARQLQLWVILGSAHPLTPPLRPHNSLYVISDEGRLVTRYDKRLCSHSETSSFYTPGTEAITFKVDGYTFGCLICIEINFPTLLIEYERLGVDCLLLSAYPVDRVFHTKARAHAAIHNYWIGLSVPTECLHLMKTGLIGPDGDCVVEVMADRGIAVADLDPSAPRYEISLDRARPWRPRALEAFEARGPVADPRSADRSLL